jgi:hypothetical protein
MAMRLRNKDIHPEHAALKGISHCIPLNWIDNYQYANFSNCHRSSEEVWMGPLFRVLITAVLLNLIFWPSEGRETNPSAEQRFGKGLVSQPPASWSSLSDRLARRKACNQQATKRGLSWRMARRYTRLCLSGPAIPKPIRQ